NDILVLEAAREVFSVHGADASVALVAKRAGVGMGSLYRRYGSKTQLLQRLCILAMEQAIDAANAALASEDAWTGLADYVRTSVAAGSGALAPLAGTIETTPHMWEVSRRGRELLDSVVARAHREGGRSAPRRHFPGHSLAHRAVRQACCRAPGCPGRERSPAPAGDRTRRTASAGRGAPAGYAADRSALRGPVEVFRGGSPGLRLA